MIISVIGSGTMGNGIAHLCAQNGYQVNLVDISDEALLTGIATVTKNLDRQISKGLITAEEKLNVLKNISACTDLKTGVEYADLIIEAATEDVDLKLKIFKQLDNFCKPEAMLTSNTSSISITKIASVTKRPEQVIGMHFMNPVPVMKLVEVIRGYATSDEVTARIMD
ncbi:MAG: 3-hydroxybutyryl-CoA dehydrogenase, partial [Flavobacterium sp.]|nr:3-hydroxybutyryl-CoA dehydrogenase [Pedobacter sp.]